MDWQTFAMAWGPAIPVFLILIVILKDAVYKTIPKGFRNLIKVIEKLDKRANERHIESLAELKRLEYFIRGDGDKKSLRKSIQDAQGGTRRRSKGKRPGSE